MEHSDHWIVTGWHGEQWDFQNNEKTMEHSDHWMKQLLMKGSNHCTAITVIDVTLNSCVLFYLVKSSKNNQGLLRKSKVYL
jgi:hypothetical protein